MGCNLPRSSHPSERHASKRLSQLKRSIIHRRRETDPYCPITTIPPMELGDQDRDGTQLLWDLTPTAGRITVLYTGFKSVPCSEPELYFIKMMKQQRLRKNDFFSFVGTNDSISLSLSLSILLCSVMLPIITCKQKIAASKQMSDMLRELISHLKDRSLMPPKCQFLSCPIRAQCKRGQKHQTSNQPVPLPVVMIINGPLGQNVTMLVVHSQTRACLQ